jgi:hypothetical protein
MQKLIFLALLCLPSLSLADPTPGFLASWPEDATSLVPFSESGWDLSPNWKLEKHAGVPLQWGKILVGSDIGANYTALTQGKSVNHQLQATISLDRDNGGVYLWLRIAERNVDWTPKSGYVFFLTGGGVEEFKTRFPGFPGGVRTGIAVIVDNKVHKMLADDVNTPHLASWAWMNPSGDRKNANVREGKWDCQSEKKEPCIQHWNVTFSVRRQQISLLISGMASGQFSPAPGGLSISFPDNTFSFGNAGIEFFNQAGMIKDATVRILPR